MSLIVDLLLQGFSPITTLDPTVDPLENLIVFTHFRSTALPFTANTYAHLVSDSPLHQKPYNNPEGLVVKYGNQSG
jgi:hypothetical protein